MKRVDEVADRESFESRHGHVLDEGRRTSALRVFRSDVQPKWEDPGNSGHGAGKWTVAVRDEAVSRAAFRLALEAMMEGMAGVNGLISSSKRGLHMLVLWTQPHGTSSGEQDFFGIRSLIEHISQTLMVSLPVKFKAHTSEGAQGNQRKHHMRPADYPGGLKMAAGFMQHCQSNRTHKTINAGQNLVEAA